MRQLSAGKSVGRSDSSPGSTRGEEGGKLRERASCAEKRTGEATFLRGRKCENALELQGGRVSTESPVQLIARESTLDKETALRTRWGAHRERVEADAQSAFWSGKEENE